MKTHKRVRKIRRIKKTRKQGGMPPKKSFAAKKVVLPPKLSSVASEFVPSSKLSSVASEFIPSSKLSSVANEFVPSSKLSSVASEFVPSPKLSSVASEFIPKCSLSDIIALDCEMVYVEKDGIKQHALAEVVIIDQEFHLCYHRYVMPEYPIVEYLTKYSGITEEKMKKARPFKEVQEELIKLLEGKTVVGHGLDSDFKAMDIDIPEEQKWDSAKIEFFMRKMNYGGMEAKKLSELTKEFLGIQIQKGPHNPVEDAESALLLFYFYHQLMYLKDGRGIFPRIHHAQRKLSERNRD